MLFFRKKKNESKLGELLMRSGSLWKAGKDTGRKASLSLDDVYGWNDEDPAPPVENHRTGLPVLRKRKSDCSM